ncbi:FGGY family carbohydrate kinase [Kaistia dalseonensis]|uniref:Xylulokinase n=1 Tax=Kaistia dalseonensis TaxID=410840 RepID=A0ABU0H5R0_9HYPH|nr:FGGY family carbohydrate kinase [Kaistia dalseonensis]MCX5495065.1 FGGY family carbohydrate kinase [Kaistia dalseonensis]MDQ0437647.1 xylulokinase [Kaistia dalseonensis]
MAGESVLVIDVGTSSVKAVLFDGGGRLLRASDHPVETLAPHPGWAEQDPRGWWQATIEAVRALEITAMPLAVTLTGSMQNVIALDSEGASLRPAILYSDARVGPDEIAALKTYLPVDFERRIGNRSEPALCLFALDWLLRHEPGMMASVERLLFGAKDAVIHRMTGRAVVDPTCATTTGLMNLAARSWDAEILGALGLSPAVLPDILDADALVGPLLPGPAAALGLEEGIPVYVGAGDGGATAWGTASEAHDRPHAYLGTTGWIAATMPLNVARPPRDAYTLAAPVKTDVIVISPFLAAGLAIDWFAGIAGRPVAELYAAAETIDAEPPEVLFLPYLIGERAPFFDRAVRGSFLGLDRQHGAEALAYAVLEGLAHAIRDNLDALPIRPSTIALAGGVAGSLTVARLIADVTGATVTVPSASRIVTAYGAFRLVAPVLGLTTNDGEAETLVAPRPERAERAARRFAAYRLSTAQARSLATYLAGEPFVEPGQPEAPAKVPAKRGRPKGSRNKAKAAPDRG